MKKKQSTILLTKEQAQAARGWIIVDAAGKTLGRLSSEIAKILRGKHKVDFTPHIDGGDGVIVINASKVTLTGSKEAQKSYDYYTGHIGGRREIPYQVMKEKKPTYIVRHAVQGMMPKTKLGKAQLKRLRIYAEGQHDMQAQTPTLVEI